MNVVRPPVVDISWIRPEAFPLSPGFLSLIQKAQREYMHYDELVHLPMPDQRRPEQVWSMVKFMRMARRELPLLDEKGRPFSFTQPDALLEGLHQIDRDSGRYIGADEPEALEGGERERYVVSSIMDEAIASSQLEGAATTRRVAREMLEEKRAPRDISERMILNNYQTMMRLKNWAGEDLTLERLNEIHRSMTDGTLEAPVDEGRLRKTNDIQVWDDRDGTPLHIPPQADGLPNRLQALFRFANGQDEGVFIHPVIKAMILHFWVAYEHPYVDGNGRTARAVFYWYLLKQKYWLFEFLSISNFILRSRAQYTRAFQYTETDDNDATYFLLYHEQAIREALKELHAHLKQAQQDIRANLGLLNRFPGLNHRQRDLVQQFVTRARRHITIGAHMTRNRVVYQTARMDLLDLVKTGLVAIARTGRPMIFTPVADLESRLHGSPDPAGAATPKALT